jgi:hypothetical protein
VRSEFEGIMLRRAALSLTFFTGSDSVTLDIYPTINFLTFGSSGPTSQLITGTGAGSPQTLTVNNGLIVGQTVLLDLDHASTISAASLTNSSQIITNADNQNGAEWPEPVPMLLTGAGPLALGWYSRRNRSKE